jgi:hypothetical protein
LRSKTSGMSVDRLYSNQKVGDLVTKAETEQNDYRRGHLLNVFFGPKKLHYIGPQQLGWSVTLSVYVRNSLVLLGATFGCLALLYLLLKRQLRTRSV